MKVLIILLLFPIITFGQGKIKFDSVSNKWFYDSSYNFHSMDTISYNWNIPKKYHLIDTIYPYHVVGLYKDGRLKVFPVKYLINKGFGLEIIGASVMDIDNLLDIYSYQDADGNHILENIICNIHKQKLVNWRSKSGGNCCCK